MSNVIYSPMHLFIQITTFKKDVLRGDGCLICKKSLISLALITDVWSKLVRVKEIAFAPISTIVYIVV